MRKNDQSKEGKGREVRRREERELSRKGKKRQTRKDCPIFFSCSFFFFLPSSSFFRLTYIDKISVYVYFFSFSRQTSFTVITPLHIIYTHSILCSPPISSNNCLKAHGKRIDQVRDELLVNTLPSLHDCGLQLLDG